MEKVLQKIKKYWQEAVVFISMLIYMIYISYASILRYDNYFAGKFDLGNMAQTVWNTAHGDIFRLTDPNATREVSRLAFHSDFILILFAPFYWIWEDPRMLLIIQTVVVAVGGIFVFLIANHILKNKNISLVLTLSYFINPGVNFANLYDFHSVTLATTFLLATFYFLFKKKYGYMLFFLILSVVTKEEVWVISGLIGLYLFFNERKRALGAIIAIVSFSFFYILIEYLMPKNLGKEHFALSYYSYIGETPFEIVINIFLNPLQTIKTLLLPDRILFIKQIFLPVGFISFLAPLMLIFAVPDLAINLLSSNPPLHQIYYQYSATITPFVFIAAIFGIRFLKSKMPRIPYNVLSLIIILFSLFSAYDYGPLPFSKNPSINTYKKTLPEKTKIDEYISSLPVEKKITATNNVGAHLSHRKDIYVIPQGLDKADRAIFLTSRSINEGEKRALIKIQTDSNYVLVFQAEGFYVFKNLK